MPPRKGKQQKGKHPKNSPEPNDDDNDTPEGDENDPNDSKETLRKVDLEKTIDPTYDVPYCYVKFFEKKNKKPDDNENPEKHKNPEKPEPSFKLIIKVDNKKGKKTSTTISWDCKDIPFPNKKLTDLESELKKDFNTTCTAKDNSIVMFGNFADKLTEYFFDKYNISENQILVIVPKPEVPKYFKITISTKDGEPYTRVKWDPRAWKDQTYQKFVDDFKSEVINHHNIEPQIEKERKTKVVYLIPDVDLSNHLFTYFKESWKMDPSSQIELDRKSRDKERSHEDEIPNIYSKQPYDQMVDRFKDKEEENYCVKMAKTIQDAYEVDQKRLENYIIKTDLKFEKSGSDKNGKNIWVTSFNVLKRISIDGIHSGRLISEGDEVCIQYKERKRTIQGLVVSINKGTVTALFKIPYGRVPPGCQHDPNEKEEGQDDDNDDENKSISHLPSDDDSDKSQSDDEDSNIEEEEDEKVEQVQEEESDYEYDEEEEEEEIPDDGDDNKNKPYSITFKPNSTTYKRSALALLHLDDMPSCPIKNIITNENLDRTFNKSSNEVIINDASFDITNSKFITDSDRQNPNIMKYLKIDATSSQTKCVEMVIQNSVSIVHGPPGCGKTSTIGLFVYHLLNISKNEKRRILLCAYSNQAVENIAKFVSPICRALGKKMVWIPNKSMCFENKREFDNATEEQKNLSFYKILTRETAEAKKYYHLQEKKWELNLRLKNFLRAKKSKKPYMGKKVEFFPASDQKKMDDIQYEIEKSLISEADVVCCTLISSAKRNLQPFIFESVFIDEASQADQMCSLIPLIHHPSKLVLLGDHKQLDSMITNEMLLKHKDTMMSLYLKLLKSNVVHVMLNMQFRMHPLIAEFPNQAFYQGKIKNAPGIEERTQSNLQDIITPIVFYDVKGKEKKVYGLTYKNINEAKTVELILNNFQINRIPGSEVGVITPYHAQAELLRNKTRHLKYDGVRISSVDTFQGSERDYIILSLVRTNREGKFGFLPDKRRINVSLTRARKGLIIVGNFKAISTSNQNYDNPRNAFLVDLCNFYNGYKQVIRADSIRKLTILVERPKSKPKSKLTIENVKKIFNPQTIEEHKKKQDSIKTDVKEPENKKSDVKEPETKKLDVKKPLDNDIYEVDDTEEENGDDQDIDIDNFGNTNNTDQNDANDEDFIFDYDNDDDEDDNDQYFANK